MSGEAHLVRVREKSESDRDRPEPTTKETMETPDRYSDAHLNFHQMVDKMESMDYEEYGPSLRTSCALETSLRIREFLQQRLNIDDQLERIWYKTDDLRNLRDALIVEPERNKVDNMIIQIKDFIDSTSLPQLISR